MGFSAGAGMLFKSKLSSARGIPSKDIPGIAPGKCYKGPPQGVILTSMTDIFKIGPGPSSSHTIAPLRISSNFRKAMEDLPKDIMDKAQSIEVRLFGSLSATGKGHRTDRAILAGLMGQKPQTWDLKLMDDLQDTTQKYTTNISDKTFELST